MEPGGPVKNGVASLPQKAEPGASKKRADIATAL